jgi:hypothetical protein
MTPSLKGISVRSRRDGSKKKIEERGIKDLECLVFWYKI